MTDTYDRSDDRGSMTRIDLGPAGPAGIEADYWDFAGARYCYIEGSNHWWDWLHHILPGARRREIAAAEAIAIELLSDSDDNHFVLGGHSLGGCIAGIVASVLVEHGHIVEQLVTFGRKMPPREYRSQFANSEYHYRARGDIVPLLTPWRGVGTHILIGKWRPFWRAHHPRTYKRQIEGHGF